MFGVTYKNVKIINELGYRIIEDNLGWKAQIVSKDEQEVFAELLLGEDLNLTVFVKKHRMDNVKYIYVRGVDIPRTLLLEIKSSNNITWWCKIPFEEGFPVFWRW